MFLMRMIYCSQISGDFNPSDIEQILEASRKNNKQEHVTGMLCFNRKYFLQCLEGDRISINKAYRKILSDKRHENILLLDYQEIDHREFTQWNMAYLPEQKITDAINLKYSGYPDFDPYSMSGVSVFNMMLELRDGITSV